MNGKIKYPKITVIVPIYNAAPYLEKCIQSIIRQVGIEFEIILVNDGSSDGTPKICDFYANKFENIKVIHKKNEGIVSARDIGLKYASGRYISFIDADDWVEEDFLQTLFNAIEETEADIVVSGCVLEINDKCEDSRNNIETGVYNLGKEENIYEKILHYEGFFQFGIQPYIWNKLYKREFIIKSIDKIDYKISDGEDVARVFPYLARVEKMVVIPDCKYHYVCRSISMSHSNKNESYMENVSRLYLSLKRNLEKTTHWNVLQSQVERYICMMIWKGNVDFFRNQNEKLFPFGRVDKNATVALYGAGFLGNLYYKQLLNTKYAKVVVWVDRREDDDLRKWGVKSIKELCSVDFDVLVIAVEKKEVCEKIKEQLVRDYKIIEEKIVF